MTGCGAVFVVLGSRPDLDRLERCTRHVCADHGRQLDWLRTTGRLLAYADQVRRYDRYDRGDRGGAQAATTTLLEASP